MQLLAAGCFRDMSRVAASSPEMWEQICLTNSSAISNILEQYIEMLETIKDNIDKKTPGYVASLFEMSRDTGIHLKADTQSIDALGVCVYPVLNCISFGLPLCLSLL